jgi:asparagine synthase (glutamine-hydrolysing)
VGNFECSTGRIELMCGICGIIGFENRTEAEPAVRRMMARLVHRGPDEEGMLAAPWAVLGMRRLSIIDLPGGGQPVWNEDGTHAVIYNGEIYNFGELRAELEALGHRFRTRSDTEVIVHAYEAWGADCVQHLRGMFSFAVAEMPGGRDGAVTRVFLARDRFGIKPLYYAFAGSKFVFASEVRALLASELVPREISAGAVASYVLFGSVGEPMSLIDGVASLPPAHRMTVDPARPAEASRPEAYWGADSVRSAVNHAGDGERDRPEASVRALLEDSVRKHLIADVPIGVFLSSGIDSTALTALASRDRAGLHTFTLIFPELEFSEAEIARRTARQFGTEHADIELSGEEMLARTDEAIAAFDSPSMDGINTYFVSWAARQAGLKVALSGLGSDEIFGGYSTFRTAPRLARLAKIALATPARLRQALAPAIDFFGGRISHGDAGRKLSAAWAEPDSLPDTYFLARALFAPAQAAELLGRHSDSWSGAAAGRWLEETVRQAGTLQGAARISWLELRTYMASTLLRDTDGMSMRHSLEVRVPFLDHPLVECALASAETNATDGDERPKALLLAALGDLLPAEVVEQRKRTFTLPWEEWMRGALRGRVGKSFAEWSPRLDAHVPGAAARGVWDAFLVGRTSWSRPWALYVLNEWVKQNLESIGAPAQISKATSVIPAVT